jgi:hypothetical protein
MPSTSAGLGSEGAAGGAASAMTVMRTIWKLARSARLSRARKLSSSAENRAKALTIAAASSASEEE